MESDMTYKVGDKVRVIGGYDNYVGRIATVTGTSGGAVYAATGAALAKHSAKDGEFHLCFRNEWVEPFADDAPTADLDNIIDHMIEIANAARYTVSEIRMTTEGGAVVSWDNVDF